MTDDSGWRVGFAPRARRKLAGHDDEWRLRVGDWRVRFTRRPDQQMIVFQRVLPRGRAYRDSPPA